MIFLLWQKMLFLRQFETLTVWPDTNKKRFIFKSYFNWSLVKNIFWTKINLSDKLQNGTLFCNYFRFSFHILFSFHLKADWKSFSPVNQTYLKRVWNFSSFSFSIHSTEKQTIKSIIESENLNQMNKRNHFNSVFQKTSLIILFVMYKITVRFFEINLF